MKKAYIKPETYVIEVPEKNFCTAVDPNTSAEWSMVKGNGGGSDEGGSSFDTGGIWDTEW